MPLEPYLQAFMSTYVFSWACDLASQMGLEVDDEGIPTSVPGYGTNFTRNLWKTIATKSDVPVPDLAAAETWVDQHLLQPQQQQQQQQQQSAGDTPLDAQSARSLRTASSALASPVAASPAPLSNDLINMAGSGIIRAVAVLLNDVLGRKGIGHDAAQLVVNDLVTRMSKDSHQFPNGTGIVDVGPLTVTIPENDYATGTVTLDALVVTGMDEFTDMKLLAVPTGAPPAAMATEGHAGHASNAGNAGNAGAGWKYTVEHSAAMPALAVSARMSTDLALGAWSTTHRTLQLDNVSVSFAVDDMRFTAATILAIDYNKLLNLSLNEITGAYAPGTTVGGIECLLDAAAALNVSDLTMSMSKLHVPVVEGLLDAPLDDLINTALSSTYEFVEFALVTHLQGIMRGPARDWLNKELGKAITNARVRVAAAGPGACSGEQRKEAAITSDASPLVDFSAQPFKFIHSFAADSLSLVDDPNLGVNRVIRAIAGYVM